MGFTVIVFWIAASLLAAIGAARADESPTTLIAQVEDLPPQQGERAPGAAAQPGAPAEPASEAPSSSSSGEVPSNIEVIKVKGRAAAAVEADVPKSVTTFDASTLQALGTKDISDLSRVTPNVNIVQPGSTQATFFVRGIGLSDFSSNAAGAVTIFQDDVALDPPAIQTGQLFDTEAVEVLRGPQGSGPYRNASAGAISVRSRRPTGNYGAQMTASIGHYDEIGDEGAKDALIQDYQGALEMPLVGEMLSARFAFRLRDADPYQTNGCGFALPLNQRAVNRPPGTNASNPAASQCGETSPFSFEDSGRGISRIPFGLPKYVGDEHNWAARGTLRFQPPQTEWDFFLNGHGSKLAQDSTLGQAIGTIPLAGGNTTPQIRFAGKDVAGYVDPDVQQEFNALCANTRAVGVACKNIFVQPELVKLLAQSRPLDQRPYRGDYDRVGQTTRDTWGGWASGEGEVFADTKLFALASYDGYKRFQDVDSDFTPDVLFETLQGDRAWQTYDELHLDGELESEPVQWSVGGYYLREDLHNNTTVAVPKDLSFPGNTGNDTTRIYSQTIDSFAFWGQFGWDFADDFTLEGGVRYNYEKKQFDFKKIGGAIPNSVVTSRDDTAWGAPTGQIILTYHIDADKAAYARYTRGFKAGHYNALATETGAEARNGTFTVMPAKPEYNDAWEAGLSGSWLTGRVSLRSSAFYYRYTDYQVFLFTDSADINEPPTLSIVNAHQAENYGVELEATVRPLEGWAPRLLSGLRLYANGSWLHGEFLDFTTFRKFAVGRNVFNTSINYSGKPLQNAPEYKFSGTAEWTFDLGRFGYLIPRYDVNWSGDVFFDPNGGRGSIDPTGAPALPPYGVGQRAYFLHNIRLAYRTPSSNIEVAGWIRNLEDQVYKNYAFDVSRFTGLVINYAGQPRTIGFDVSLSF